MGERYAGVCVDSEGVDRQGEGRVDETVCGSVRGAGEGEELSNVECGGCGRKGCKGMEGEVIHARVEEYVVERMEG